MVFRRDSLDVATCNRKRLNLQSSPLSDRHYLQLKDVFKPELPATESAIERAEPAIDGFEPELSATEIGASAGAENPRLLDAIPVTSRSTSGVAYRCPETQLRKQRPDLAWKDEFLDSGSVATNVGLPATIAGLTRVIAGSVALNVGFGDRQLQIMSVEKHP